jgi:hypothetical protein
MPQMFKYCGQRFQVYKRADKTCDTVSGHYVGRHLPKTVHLQHRCDGEAYGGCQAGCLIFWKEAWLKPLPSESSRPAPATADQGRMAVGTADMSCTEEDIWRATKHQLAGGETRYRCQATELLHFTTPLKWWDARQYVETYRAGNASLSQILRGLFYLVYCHVTLARRPAIGCAARWLYDRFQTLWGGLPFPERKGSIPIGRPTPIRDLRLREGDLVRVKSYQEILSTLDIAGSNRGLSFDAELVPYCGKIYRVKTRVENFIDEKTGKMRHLRTPAVILEGVYCSAQFSGKRIFCSRSIYTWWREIWLEKVSETAASHHVSETKRRLQNTRSLEASSMKGDKAYWTGSDETGAPRTT